MRQKIGNLANEYQDLLHAVRHYGNRVTVRGLNTFECENAMIEIKDPARCLIAGVGRNLNPRIAAAEALQLIAGVQYPTLMSSISDGNFDQFMDGGSFHGGYGDRIASQMPFVIDRLEADSGSRRALATFWNAAQDLYMEGLHDYPCTASIGFRIREDRLNMTVHMRSNDIWLGFPYDVFQFSNLMMTVANILDVYVGTYVHFVDSLHLYETDVPKIDAVINGPTVGVNTQYEFDGIADAVTWQQAASSAHMLLRGENPVPDSETGMYDWWLHQTQHKTWILK